jgi:MFS family permease
MDARRRDLRRLAAAVGLSALGDLLALIALVLAVERTTGSSVAVAALFATTLVPVVALAPLAGLLVDRVENVRVLVLASLAQAAAAAALAFAGTDLAFILVLSALLAAGSAVSLPAEAALVPAIAGDQRLTEANGLMESARYAGCAAGPVVAAGLTALSGTQLALAVNAVSFLVIALAAASLSTRRRPEPGAEDLGTVADALAGGRQLWNDRVLRVVVGAAVAALACVSVTLTAEVFYAKDVLHASDSVYALLTGAWMVGMVLGASRIAPRVRPELVATGALAGLVVQGAAIAGQVAFAVVPVALAAFMIGGLGHGAKNALIRTLVARRVPERLHGRAFAAYNAARNAAELSAIGVGGALVAGVGASTALAIAGVGPVVFGLAALMALRRPLSAPSGRLQPET